MFFYNLFVFFYVELKRDKKDTCMFLGWRLENLALKRPPRRPCYRYVDYFWKFDFYYNKKLNMSSKSSKNRGKIRAYK